MTPISSLRQLFPKYNIGYYIVLTQDAHDSEYVAEADTRRAFLTGFTGSAGTAVVGLNSGELSTDGRYFLQASNELSSDWSLRKMGTPGTSNWVDALAHQANKESATIGVDPKLISWSLAKSIEKLLTKGKLVPVETNLVDEIWQNKPAEPNGKVVELSEKVTGETSTSKLERLREKLSAKQVDGIVLSALDDIAWLFNLRGSDIEYNPVFKSYAIITSSKATLYVDKDKVEDINYPHVELAAYDQVWQDLKEFDGPMWVPEGSSWAVAMAYKEIGAKDDSPVKGFKAVKNSTEIQGAKDAQLKCAISIVKLLSWLDEVIDTTRVTEYEAAEKLLQIRQTLPEFRGNSFATISSVGANAAIIHFHPSPEGEATVNRNEVFLLDTGCQFTHGTTDTTRTVHFGTPSEMEKEAYTLVLKGHIALAELVFPSGTIGSKLDAFARQHLWRYGLEYRHGTGHGVGSYLNVHEGPVGFGAGPHAKAPLEVGNLISNEPGYYEDGKFGIRIENLVIVKEQETKYKFGGKPFLGLDTITVVPLALNLIDKSLLTSEEIKWVNAYSSRVRDALSPHLEGKELEWVKKHTEQL